MNRLCALALIGLGTLATGVAAQFELTDAGSAVALRAIERPVRYDGHVAAKVQIRRVRDLQALTAMDVEFWSCRIGVGATQTISAPRERIEALRDAGLELEIIIDDVQGLIDTEAARIALGRLGPVDAPQGLALDPFFDDYRPLNEVEAYLDTLVALDPAKVSKVQVGTTFEGREMYALEITAAATPKPALMLSALQHAREWITVPSVMRVADRLIRDYGVDPFATKALDNLTIIVQPVSNPDGYVHTWTSNRLWRKNRRPTIGGEVGVDMNRNWSVGYGLDSGSSSSPSFETYRGPNAFSEPETQDIRDYILSRPNIRGHFDVHSFSQLVLGPWAYTNDAAPRGEVMLPLGQNIADVMTTTNPEASYLFGVGGAQLGLASGVFPDWTFGAANGEGGVLSWTLELRDTGQNGFILPASQIEPNSEEVWEAFRLLVERLLRPIEATFPNAGPPASIEPGAAQTVQLRLEEITGVVNAAASFLMVRPDGAPSFSAIPLTLVSGDAYEATFPAGACGDSLEYFVSAVDTFGLVSETPAGGAGAPFVAQYLMSEETFDDDFEANLGWTVNPDAADDATTGVWVRVDPNGSEAQPENDHTDPGAQCFVTGQAAPGAGVGANDVDGGVTTLRSPRLDAQGDGEAWLSYWVWWSNDKGSNPDTDTLQIDISNDDGASWTPVETIAQSLNEWTQRRINVGDFVTPTDEVRIRFIASDLVANGGSVAEAGVDDVRLELVGCSTLPADLDGDGSVGPNDLGLLLGAWGPGAGPADLNGDGEVDAEDLAQLLGAWTT